MSSRTRVAGYGRVSTLKQALEGTSAEDQEQRIKTHCQKEGWELYKFYGDEGISGKSMEHRPGIQELIKDARDGKFDVVLFTKLDRVGRNARDLQNFCHLIQKEYKLNLVCIDVPLINTKGPFGKLMLGILGAFAEFERGLIRERMVGGRQKRWQEGKAVVGALPYGYVWDKEQKAIRLHKKQAAVVRRIYSMYVNENYSMKDIAIKLSEEGVPTPSDAKGWRKEAVAARWNHYAVRKILNNHAYTGRTIEHNKHKRATVVSRQGKKPYMRVIDELKPENEWVPVTCPPLVTEEQWEQAQKRRSHQKIKPKKHHYGYKDRFLAENVVYCGECGGRMGKSVKRDRHHKAGKARLYYVCNWKKCSRKDLIMSGRQRCSLTSVDSDHVDRTIWNRVVIMLSNPAKYAKQWFQDPDTEALRARVNKLKADEEEAERKCLVGLRHLVGMKDPELKQKYKRELDKYEREHQSFKQARKKAETELVAADNKFQLLSEFKKAMQQEAKKGGRWGSQAVRSYSESIRRFLNNLPFEEKKRVLEAVVSPENGGRCAVRYQRPKDYVDDENLLNTEEELLDEPQPEMPKYTDLQFFLDLEKVRAIIGGLDKGAFLRKSDQSGTPLPNINNCHSQFIPTVPLASPVAHVCQSDYCKANQQWLCPAGLPEVEENPCQGIVKSNLD